MARTLNQVTLLGNLGNDPEVRSFQNGGRVLTFNVATSEFWKDRNGEQRERTEWHRVAAFVDALVDVGEKYLRKGSKVLVQGKLETREWTDQDGVRRTATEIALRPFQGNLVLLDAPNDRNEGSARRERQPAGAGAGGRDIPEGNLDDSEIPF